MSSARATALIIITALTLAGAHAAAQGSQAGLSTDPTLPVTVAVNGTPTTLPADVPAPAEVCVLNTTVYATLEKYVFTEWVIGDNHVTTPCTTVGPGEEAVAKYRKYVAIAVTTDPPIKSWLYWVPAGAPANITAPAEIEDGDIKYVFRYWVSGPIPDSTNRTVQVVASSPQILKAAYEPRYPVYVDGELLGYYAPGDTVTVTLHPTNVAEGVREVPTAITGPGASVRSVGNVFIITVKGPADLVTVKQRQYLVTIINNATGTARTEWVPEGTPYTARTDSIIQIGDSRYVFTGWAGDVTSPSTAVTVTINSPTTLIATYVLQHPVRVVTPSGDKTVYVTHGSPYVGYAPPEYPGLFTARVLTHVLINGSPAEAPDGVILIPHIRGPTTVVAAYATTVVWANVAAAAAVIWSAAAAYYLITLPPKAATKKTPET